MKARHGSKTGSAKLLVLAVFCWQNPVFAQAQLEAGAAAAKAQNFALFEGVETAQAGNNFPNRLNRESRASATPPEFTLLGTSRIGSQYSAILRHRSGETILLKAEAGTNTAIAGHAGYAIVNMAAAAVSIRYPGNNPCVEFSERGVRCNDAANIAELVLANGEPLPSRNPALNQLGGDNAAAADVENANADPSNPFEALRNGQAVRNSAAAQEGNRNGGRFTPRRISPEDVPEGMRIVATPFGDRLVEQ